MGQSADNLIKEIQKGNEAAMELLVSKNYHMVQAFIYRMIGDYNLSYDLTQEVFIKMLTNLPRYQRTDAGFETWLLTIASNHCKDYFRTNSYRQRKENANIDDLEIESNDSIVDVLERNEKRKEVKKAVEDLPYLQREAIILKYFHELRIHEISSITGENENTIKSRLFQGMKNLRKAMGGDGVEKRKKI